MGNRRSRLGAKIAAAASLAGLLPIPAAANAATGSSITIGPVSPVPVITQLPTTGGTAPESITAGPDGNIWYTEVEVPEGGLWQVGRLTFLGQGDGPEGSISNFSKNISTAGPAPHGDLFGITAGPDGNIWYTGLFGVVGRVTTGGVASFQTKGITGTDLQGITTGPDGNLWFAGADGIGRITPHGVVTEFSKGITPEISPFGPFGITVGPDHNLWFTENDSGKIGRITPRGVVSEFQIAPNNGPGFQSFGLQGIATGPDGNLWVTDVANDSIYRVNPSECSAKSHGCNGTTDIGLSNTPGLSSSFEPQSITAGSNKELWIANGEGELAEMTTSGQVTVLQGTGGDGGNDSPQAIAQGPDGTLWYTETHAGEIGEVSFCSPILCDAHLTVGAGAGDLTGTLHKAALIGVLVQQRQGGRLVTVGRVPLGDYPAGPFRSRWPLRVSGRLLAPGHYRVTLRALKGNQTIDETQPATITIPAPAAAG